VDKYRNYKHDKERLTSLKRMKHD